MRELMTLFGEQSELEKEINREIEKAKTDGANAEEKAKSEEERLKELGSQIKDAAKNQAMSCLNGRITTKNARIEANEKNIKEVHEYSLGIYDFMSNIIESQISDENKMCTLTGIVESLFQYLQKIAKPAKSVYDLFAYNTEMNEETNKIMKSVMEKNETRMNEEEREKKRVTVWLTVVTILAVLGLFL